jgi:hypothetical protein
MNFPQRCEHTPHKVLLRTQIMEQKKCAVGPLNQVYSNEHYFARPNKTSIRLDR